MFEAQVAASPQRFRGVRHRAAWAEPPVVARRPTAPEHLLLDPEFRRGYAHLHPCGLTFEGWIYHTRIADLADLRLARARPTAAGAGVAEPLDGERAQSSCARAPRRTLVTA